MNENILSKLGPLAHLAGTWEGEKGQDRAPSDERGIENNKFKEVMVFTPFGPTRNHEQELYGLRYSTTAWEIGKPDPFHEELGYWLWDANEKQVMRCFMIPRGVVLIAGGTVENRASEFKLSAELGSETYGICSNKFLDKEFKTVAYDFKITFHSDESFSYEEDTQIKMKGVDDIFHHIDSNTMKKIPPKGT